MPVADGVLLEQVDVEFPQAQRVPRSTDSTLDTSFGAERLISSRFG